MACKKESDGYDRKLQRSGQRHVKRFGAGIVGGICFRTLHFDLSLMTAVQSAVAIILMLVVYTKTHFNDYYVEKRK